MGSGLRILVSWILDSGFWWSVTTVTTHTGRKKQILLSVFRVPSLRNGIWAPDSGFLDFGFWILLYTVPTQREARALVPVCTTLMDNEVDDRSNEASAVPVPAPYFWTIESKITMPEMVKRLHKSTCKVDPYTIYPKGVVTMLAAMSAQAGAPVMCAVAMLAPCVGLAAGPCVRVSVWHQGSSEIPPGWLEMMNFVSFLSLRSGGGKSNLLRLIKKSIKTVEQITGKGVLSPRLGTGVHVATCRDAHPRRHHCLFAESAACTGSERQWQQQRQQLLAAAACTIGGVTLLVLRAVVAGDICVGGAWRPHSLTNRPP
jgi:hypothetical protein